MTENSAPRFFVKANKHAYLDVKYNHIVGHFVTVILIFLAISTEALGSTYEAQQASPLNATIFSAKFASSSTNLGAALVGYKRTEAGAVARTIAEKASELLTPEDFGAVGDGVTDDTAALQAAVDAWALNKSVEIRLNKRYLITGTLTVANIETDNPENRLNFTGSGTLIKNNAGYLFDKPPTQALQTGHINFTGIRFEGANLSGQTFLFNGNNIIRVHFMGCFGTKINIAKANQADNPTRGYLQTIYLQNTTWRKWSGYLLDTGRLYDVSIIGSVFESGDAVLITRMTTADPAANSLRIIGSNIEGMSGTSGAAVKVGVTWGSIVSGNYFERNAGGDLDFNGGTGFHKGLTIEANGFQPTSAQIASGTYYPVITGKGAGDSLALIGNASTNNLFDVTMGNLSAVVDIGNFTAAGGIRFSTTSPRLFSFSGSKLTASLLPGYGVSINAYHSSIGFEPTRTIVGDEPVAAEVLYGKVSPQLSPSSYPQKNWKRGTIVFHANPLVAVRKFSGKPHNTLIMGWVCLSDGAPGTWTEITIILPD